MEHLVEPDRIPKDFMGIVRADLFLENSEDRTIYERGLIAEDEIRSLIVTGLVDTGARMLFLPQDLVERLGLTTRRTTRVRYADGRQEEVPMAGPLSITIQGRTMESNCLVGPANGEVLIGQIELERLDFLINCAERTLVPNPASPDMPLLPV